jgi:hypothetical protein
MPAIQFGHPLYPLVAFATALALTGLMAFALLYVTHLFHRTPQEHCVMCRRGGE